MKIQHAFLSLTAIIISCNTFHKSDSDPTPENCRESIQVEIHTVQNVKNDSLLFLFADSQTTTNPIYSYDTTKIPIHLQLKPRVTYRIAKGDYHFTTGSHSSHACSSKSTDTIRTVDTAVYYDTLRINNTLAAVDHYIRTTPPRIVIDSAARATLQSPAGGLDKKLPITVLHFYMDNAQLSVQELPSWATLDTIDLCEEGLADSLFQPQGGARPYGQYIECYSEGTNSSLVLHLRPDTLDIGKVFDWSIKVSNRYGQRDSLHFKSIPVPYE